MFYNLKIILRTLHRNITYSTINIVGLAIGITASVLIFLWVHHEKNMDMYHTGADRICRITNTLDFGQGKPLTLAHSPFMLGSALMDMPEIEKATLLYSSPVSALNVSGEIFSVANQVVYVDKSWFEVFDYQLLEGSISGFCNQLYGIVLTESEAKKYFGNVSSIGQIIDIQGVDYSIQAVVKNHPAGSSFKWNVMLSMDTYQANPEKRSAMDDWEQFQWIAFAKLRAGANLPGITQKINDVYAKNCKTISTASLRPLADTYFETDIQFSVPFFARGESKTVSLFALLGVLLLLIACVNYVNLTTARANVNTIYYNLVERRLSGHDACVV